MDRGAARSRKRAAKLSNTVDSASGPSSGPTRYPQSHAPSNGGWKRDEAASGGAGPSRPRAPLPSQEASRPRKGAGGVPAPRPKKVKKVPTDDPNQYKPKAIRNSTALIYAQSPFPIPPPKDRLVGVTRIDLGGSECEDVSWLEGMGVTWLSLKGCNIQAGWAAVGKLSDLAVLNISECGLKALPKSLKGLGKLKAVVAMSNPWETLDNDVLSSWTELNSLIISHSPNLRSLPSALEDLHHLSKFTFSHCPRITSKSLPDLSGLPLLRDVKMNNLPQLTSLPAHLSTWGTGDLSLVKNVSAIEENRKGDGLEVLDLGNCSLDWDSISTSFGLSSTKSKKSGGTWKHLRSLTLHSNPFAGDHPDYADLLQQSAALPKLQIIDSKRVIERKHAGEVPQTKYERLKKERKERKYGKSDEGYKQRPKAAKQGEDEVGEQEEAPEKAIRKEKDKKERLDPEGLTDSAVPAGEKSGKKRKREETSDKPRDQRPKKTSHTVEHNSVPQSTEKHRKQTAAPPQDTSDPSLIHTSAKRGPGTESAVMQVIEIPRDQPSKDPKKKDKASKPKGKDGKVVEASAVKSGGGIDLREVFSAPKKDDADEGTGLGVGGW